MEAMDDDDDDDDDDDSSSSKSSGSSNIGKPERQDSISNGSIDSLADHSIGSGPSDLPDVVDKDNYLPYVSDKYAV